MPNLSDLTNIKIGNTDIQYVYSGGNLVWEREPDEVVFPEDGLLAYYKLDGNGKDERNYAPLTETNVTWETGKIEDAGNFIADESRLEATDSSLFNFDSSDSFSFSLWFKRISINNYGFILDKRSSDSTYRGYNIAFNGDDNNIDVVLSHDRDAGERLYVRTQNSYTDTNKWYHLVITYDGSTNSSGLKIYVDTVEQVCDYLYNNLTGDMTNFIKLRIGSLSYADTNQAESLLDEIGIWDRVLTPEEVSDLYNEGIGLTYTAPKPAFPEDGLLAYYKLDGDGTDQCEYADLTPTSVTWETGKIEDAGNFTSSDSRLEAADSSLFSFDYNNSFSFSMWFKKDNTTSGRLVTKHDGGNSPYPGYSLYLAASDNKIKYSFYSNSSDTNRINVSWIDDRFTDGNWHLFTFTYNGNTHDANDCNLYIDSELITNKSITDNTLNTSTITTKKLNICNLDGYNQSFMGIIDEIGIWDRVLTPEEVSALYNDGIGNSYTNYIPRKNLVAWYGDYVNKGVLRTTLKDGDPITQWDDIVGKVKGGLDFIKSGTDDIEYDETKQGLLFSGSQVLSNSTGAELSNEMTMFFVTTKSSNNQTYIISGFEGSTGNKYDVISQYDPGDGIKDLEVFGSGLERSTFAASTDDNVHILTYNVSNNNSFQIGRFDGTEVFNYNSNSANLSSTTLKYIGCNDGDGPGWFSGTISELLIYDRALDDCEIAEVENYLADKYGISLPMSINRPNKYVKCSKAALMQNVSDGTFNVGAYSPKDFTVTGWFGIPSNNTINFTYLFGHETSASNKHYQIYQRSSIDTDYRGADFITYLDGSATESYLDYQFEDGKWYFYVLRYSDSLDKQSITVYSEETGLIGETLIDATNSISSYNNRLLLGASRYTSGGTEYYSMLSSVGFYSRYLTDDEIVELWNNGNGLSYYGICKSETLHNGLVEWWNLDDWNGTECYGSVNKNDTTKMVKSGYTPADGVIELLDRTQSTLNQIQTEWNNPGSPQDKLNIIYDIIIDAMQEGLTDTQKNNIVDWLQSIKSGQDLPIINQINSLIDLLLD